MMGELRSTEQAFQACAKVFSVSLDSRCALFLFGPQPGLCILYAFPLCKFTCAPLTAEAGICHKYPLSTTVIKNQEKKLDSLTTHLMPTERNELQDCLAFIPDKWTDKWTIAIHCFQIHSVIRGSAMPHSSYIFNFFVLCGCTSRMSLCPPLCP